MEKGFAHQHLGLFQGGAGALRHTNFLANVTGVDEPLEIVYKITLTADEDPMCETCANCRFSREGTTPAPGGHYKDGTWVDETKHVDVRRCHRRAPTTDYHWPVVDDATWCGDWEG